MNQGPDMSRVNAFLSRAKLRESGAAKPNEEAPEPKARQIDIHHGLSFDKVRKRHVARFTVDCGGKVVGKRVAVRIPTTDQEIAVLARDAILDFCFAVGIGITRRPQRRERELNVNARAARAECKRLIIASVGPGGFEAFLKAPQPAFEDLTGDFLLLHRPGELLNRLKELAKETRGEA